MGSEWAPPALIVVEDRIRPGVFEVEIGNNDPFRGMFPPLVVV
jgi:hypothetical protein